MRITRTGAVCAGALLPFLVAALPAAECRLVDGGLGNSEQYGYGGASDSPREVLAKEPEYKSDKPVYLTLELGNAKDRFVTGVLDESGGTGTGYETLILDANHNHDLTDDTPMKASPGKQRNPRELMLRFGPLPVTVRYHDGTERALKVSLSLRGYRYSRGEEQISWGVGYQVAQHIEGEADFGGKKVRLAIYDAVPEGTRSENGNGCFDDYGMDRLRVDLNGDGALDEETEDFPLSKVFPYDGKLWNIEVDSFGKQITVRPSQLPTGRVALKSAFSPGSRIESGHLEFSSHQGCAFSYDLGRPGALLVPAGRYRLGNGSLTLKDAKETEWEVAFALPKALSVAAGQSVSLAVGQPVKLQPVVEGRPVPGGQVSVSHKLTGAGGEVYSSVSPANGRKPPVVTIADAEGVRVGGGPMTYG
jgi:hypothetical protein